MWNTSYTINYFGEMTMKASRAYRGRAFFPQGRMLGGTSSVNAMIYSRGVKDDYDNWNVTGWKYDDVLPYFLKNEGNMKRAKGKYHNTEGPSAIDDFPNEEIIKKGILDGAAELGYDILQDMHEDIHNGFVLAQGTIKNGERFSAAKAYLTPIKNRPNLKVIKNGLVTSLIINNNKQVEGVNFELRGRNLKARARKEVILSAGALESPKILMLSGVGKNEDLQPFNIPQITDLPVGYNLQDHVHSTLNFKFLKSLAPDDSLADASDSMYSYLTKRKGSLSSIGCFNLLGFINTKNLKDKINPDIEFLHECFPKKMIKFEKTLEAFGLSDNIIAQLVNADQEAAILGSSATLLRPKSRGTVKLNSRNIRDHPKINLGYFDNEEDMQTIIRAIREYRKLLKTKSFIGFEVEELRYQLTDCDVLKFDSDDYWRCYVSYFSTTMYHLVGTCKLGAENDLKTVVLPNLKVKNLKSLRTIDASVMPNIISGHTNNVVMMIAEKGCDLIKAEWP